MSEQAKPCPFCGKDARDQTVNRLRVCCSDDNCPGARDWFLLERWNARATSSSSAVDELVDRVVDRIHPLLAEAAQSGANLARHEHEAEIERFKKDKFWNCTTCGAMAPKRPDTWHSGKCAQCIEINKLMIDLARERAEVERLKKVEQEMWVCSACRARFPVNEVADPTARRCVPCVQVEKCEGERDFMNRRAEAWKKRVHALDAQMLAASDNIGAVDSYIHNLRASLYELKKTLTQHVRQ